MVLAWLVVAVALLLFEAHHWAFYALFGAIGALAAAVVAIAAPGAYAAQAGVAIGLSAIGVVGARPYVSRIAHRHRGGTVARGVHGGIVGEEVLTLDEVGDTHHAGHVGLAGERWLAISRTGEAIPADTPVLVTEVKGTTLVVLPTYELEQEK